VPDTKDETWMVTQVERLRASEDKLHEDEKLHRKFKWSVMINVSSEPYLGFTCMCFADLVLVETWSAGLYQL